METEVTHVTPECHAEKCPVCNGFTTVNYGKQKCQACEGRGFVVVPNFIREDRREKNESQRKHL